jgi:hypothetical protein
MITYAFEFQIGKQYRSKLFLDRSDAHAYGVKINADLMREIDNLMPSDWMKPKELQELYYEYKTKGL